MSHLLRIIKQSIMSQSITAKVTKKSEEKSWMADPANRCTIEFEVGYNGTSEGDKDAMKKDFSGSTLTLVTLDKKVAGQFKIGDECTITVKAK